MKFTENWRTGAALVLIACAALSGGCQPRALTVGTVDTEQIIRENPKYMEMSVMFSDERSQLFSQIPSNVRSLSGAERKALQERIAKEAAERSSRFDKLYRETMAQLQKDIQAQAAEVAREKNLDLVVINTMRYPVVLYSAGDNITLDILLKMDGAK